VTELQPFTTIERPTFRSSFADLLTLPFGSRRTLQRRVESHFALYRFKGERGIGCYIQYKLTSLDVWISKSSIAILRVIGRLQNEDFEYQEHLLEFKEIEDAHRGENMAEMIEDALIDLNLEHKLLAIIAENASNNETLVSKQCLNLSRGL
ncbi:hypothetical protein V1506DRAFT_444193, partial [Lipomyces tetrasporus]